MGNTDNCKPTGEVSGEDKPRLSQPVSLKNAKQLGCLKIQRNDVTVLKHLEVEFFFFSVKVLSGFSHWCPVNCSDEGGNLGYRRLRATLKIFTEYKGTQNRNRKTLENSVFKNSDNIKWNNMYSVHPRKKKYKTEQNFKNAVAEDIPQISGKQYITD